MRRIFGWRVVFFFCAFCRFSVRFAVFLCVFFVRRALNVRSCALLCADGPTRDKKTHRILADRDEIGAEIDPIRAEFCAELAFSVRILGPN